MAERSLENCLEILTTALEMLEQGDIEIIINNLYFVITNVQQLGQQYHPAVPLIDRAIILLLDLEQGQQQVSSVIGRPKIDIPAHSLEFLLSLNFSVTTIASLLGVSRRTIHRRFKALNLSIAQSYSTMDDEELDTTVSEIVINHPNTGYKRMKGFLLDAGLKVTNQRVLDSLRRVDPLGVQQRRGQNRAIYRRTYFVQYSMELWHIDTHHKLIRYGIVVRGGIDGKSRTIVYLDVGANNTARSNFESFIDGVNHYGVPIRTRTDKGGENVEIARFMLETRGVGRGSHICGRSVHNQRIERLWRDVHYGCLSAFKSTFVQLEETGYLDVDSPFHLAVLQKVFIPRIKKCLDEFTAAWNRHALSSEHGRTPLQLMLMNLPPPDMVIEMSPAPEYEDSNDVLICNDDDLRELQLQNIVVVEDFQSILSVAQLQWLNSVDMLRQSEQFGSDLYIQAIEALGRM